MLEEIQKLKETLTESQRETLKKKAGPKLYAAIESILEADDEASARARVIRLSDTARRKPLKILKIRSVLTDEQQDIIIDLMSEVD